MTDNFLLVEKTSQLLASGIIFISLWLGIVFYRWSSHLFKMIKIQIKKLAEHSLRLENLSQFLYENAYLDLTKNVSSDKGEVNYAGKTANNRVIKHSKSKTASNNDENNMKQSQVDFKPKSFSSERDQKQISNQVQKQKNESVKSDHVSPEAGVSQSPQNNGKPEEKIGSVKDKLKSIVNEKNQNDDSSNSSQENDLALQEIREQIRLLSNQQIEMAQKIDSFISQRPEAPVKKENHSEEKNEPKDAIEKKSIAGTILNTLKKLLQQKDQVTAQELVYAIPNEYSLADIYRNLEELKESKQISWPDKSLGPQSVLSIIQAK